MKNAILIFLLLCAWPAFSAEPLKITAGTNETIITYDNGAYYTNNTLTYLGNVHVSDPQMEMLSEILTISINTNKNTIDLIIAETNVVLIQQTNWAIGDKAVYNLTNDIVELTGNVLMDNPHGSALVPKVIYDRKLNTMTAPGRGIWVIQPLSNTNRPFIPQIGTPAPKK
jgi:lipopolysaccharide export system protein LptA